MSARTAADAALDHRLNEIADALGRRALDYRSGDDRLDAALHVILLELAIVLTSHPTQSDPWLP